MKTLYDILGIPQKATQQEIEQAYRDMIIRYHPDKNQHTQDKKFYENKMDELNDAYYILKDPQRRINYDTGINTVANTYLQAQETKLENKKGKAPVEEKMFLQIPNILVTTKRYVVAGTTYDIELITNPQFITHCSILFSDSYYIDFELSSEMKNTANKHISTLGWKDKEIVQQVYQELQKAIEYTGQYDANVDSKEEPNNDYQNQSSLSSNQSSSFATEDKTQPEADTQSKPVSSISQNKPGFLVYLYAILALIGFLLLGISIPGAANVGNSEWLIGYFLIPTIIIVVFTALAILFYKKKSQITALPIMIFISLATISVLAGAITNISTKQYVKGKLSENSKNSKVTPVPGSLLEEFEKGNNKQPIKLNYVPKPLTVQQEANAYNEEGNRKSANKDYQGAIESYTKAIELDPNEGVYYYNRGNAKSWLGLYTGAISDYNEAMNATSELTAKLNGESSKLKGIKGALAISYHNRGIEKENQGDYQGALSDLEEALKYNPNDTVIRKNYNTLNQQLGN